MVKQCCNQCGFFHSILVFKNFEPATDINARVIGVARQMYVAKPMLKQARALFVPELKALEDVVVDEIQPHLVVIAGYLLFCVMGVCRFSDLLYSKGLSVQTTLSWLRLELQCTRHTGEKRQCCYHGAWTCLQERQVLGRALGQICLINSLQE